MRYLKKTIEDIEGLYIIDVDDYYSKFQDALFFRDEESLAKSTFECWECSEYDTEFDRLSGRIPIDCSEYSVKKGHRKYFNYSKLEMLFDKRSFEAEILVVLNKDEESYLSEFNGRIESLKTVRSSVRLIRSVFNDLSECLYGLYDLQFNSYQKIVSKAYSKSYIKVLRMVLIDNLEFYKEFLKEEVEMLNELDELYQDKFIDDEDLLNYIYPDKHACFIEYETQLVSKGFLDNKSKWISNKNNLIRFFMYLQSKEFIKSTKKNPTLYALMSFEERYSVNLGKSKEPNRRNKIEDKKNIFHFLK